MATGATTLRARAQQIARAKYPEPLATGCDAAIFRAALDFILPAPQHATAIVELFNNRASWPMVRNWKYRGGAPQWARELLAKKIEAHCEPLLKALRSTD